ncbi:2-isopropylmalate synthase [candidate division KSB1 bacterium]
MKKRIKVFDTTLRDGEQSPGFSMHLEEKIRMALQLEKLNVEVIEAGFPIASDGDYNAVKEISKVIEKCIVAGLCRASVKDIDRAWEALQHAKMSRIHTFIATSDLHLKYKLKKDRSEVLKDVEKAVKYSKSLCRDVEFSAEDASRSDRDFLVEVLNLAVESGANVINIPDTVGYSLPEEFGKLVKYIYENVKDIEKTDVSIHCHNDLGMAVANSYAGILNGANQVECTINGIGERAGNASLEEMVMLLKTRQQSIEYYTGINTKQLYPSSRLLTKITGIDVQPNKAIVGKNAFAHEAGIHQDGVLKNPLTYEIITPQAVGKKSNNIVIGKHSGKHALSVELKELGYILSKEKIEIAYNKIMAISDLKKSIKIDDLINAAEYAINRNQSFKGSYDYDINEQTILTL